MRVGEDIVEMCRVSLPISNPMGPLCMFDKCVDILEIYLPNAIEKFSFHQAQKFV